MKGRIKMKEEALELAKMMNSLSPEEKNKFITLLDKCPVLNFETLSEKEKQTGLISDENLRKFSHPKIFIVLQLRNALMAKNPELSALAPHSYVDSLTPIVGQGVADYLHMEISEKRKFKDIVRGKVNSQKSFIISQMRQNTQT